MPSNRGTESTFELTTIERLEQLGYVWMAGPELVRPADEVVLKEQLRVSLAARYPDLPATARSCSSLRA